MSDRVDVVRRIYEEWGRGNFREGLELYDPHAVFVEGIGPDGGVYYGVDAIKSFMRGFLGAWAQVTITADELLPAGESVLASVHQRGTGNAQGVAAELRYFQVWTFRGDAVVRLEHFRDRADALVAIGLKE